jgi:hypothetical protein
VGTLHVLSGTGAMVLFPIAALLVGRDVVPGNRWIAVLPLAGLVAQPLLFALMPPEGWPPRLLILTYLVWVVTVAAVPFSSPPSAVPAPPAVSAPPSSSSAL